MSLTCPVCRAENATGLGCRRCRADLTLIAAVEARREYHVATARCATRDGRMDDALEDLTKAASLRDSPDIRQIRACAYLMARYFAAALAEHAQITRS